MRKIFIGHHFFGAGNVGDDLMLAGFLAAVRAKHHSLTFTCSIPHPRESQARRFPEIRWISYEPEQRYEALAACDVWVGLGGSPFQSDDSEWFTEHLRVELQWCRQLKKPVYFLGVGVNNAEVLKRQEIQSFIDSACRIWARDSRSYSLLVGAAKEPEKIALGADLAHCVLPRLAPTLGETGSSSGLGYCLNFQSDLGRNQPALEALVSRAGSVAQRWYVQEVRELPGGERAMHRRLADSIREKLSERIPDYESESLERLLSEFAPCRCFLTSRYHSAILQAWLGARVAVFAINDKLRAIAEELCVPAYERLEEVDPNAENSFLPVPRERLYALASRAYGSVTAFLGEIGTAPPAERSETRWNLSCCRKKRLLFVCPDSIGDLVLRQPLLARLSAEEFAVTVAARPNNLGLLPFLGAQLEGLSIESHPYFVDRSDPEAVEHYAATLRTFVEGVEQRDFGAMLFPAFNRTIIEEVLLKFLSDVPVIRFASRTEAVVPLSLLFPAESGAHERSRENCIEVSAAERWHETKKLEELASAGLGLHGSLGSPRLHLCADAQVRALEVLRGLDLEWGHYVISCPEGTTNVPIKAVPEALSHCGLETIFRETGKAALLVGVEAERAALERLQARCVAADIPVRVWIGRDDDLSCLVGLLAGSCCYFGGDTGPMHLASAFGIPVFAVMGGGTYPRFLPPSERSRIVAQELACFGCNWSCVFPGPRCLTEITEARVTGAVKQFLELIPTWPAAARASGAR